MKSKSHSVFRKALNIKVDQSTEKENQLNTEQKMNEFLEQALFIENEIEVNRLLKNVSTLEIKEWDLLSQQ